MMPLHRAPAPAFWAQKQRQWFEKLALFDGKRRDPLGWDHENKDLRWHFHREVQEGGSRHCAYCDCVLGVESRRLIDHFFPKAAFPVLALCWENLYPACQVCNEEHKDTRWSCGLLRPDVDLTGDDDLSAFSRLFWFDPDSGRLLPAPELARRMKARVRLTLRIFGLNTIDRCKARRQKWKDLMNAAKAGDPETLSYSATDGPYRFIALEFLRSTGA